MTCGGKKGLSLVLCGWSFGVLICFGYANCTAISSEKLRLFPFFLFSFLSLFPNFFSSLPHRERPLDTDRE